MNWNASVNSNTITDSQTHLVPIPHELLGDLDKLSDFFGHVDRENEVLMAKWLVYVSILL